MVFFELTWRILIGAPKLLSNRRVLDGGRDFAIILQAVSVFLGSLVSLRSQKLGQALPTKGKEELLLAVFALHSC